MDASELFLLRYRFSYPGMICRMLADLTERRVRTPPRPGVNMLAWHVAREILDIGAR